MGDEPPASADISALTDTLLGLVRSNFRSPHDVDQLVCAAEVRLIRLRRHQLKQSRWWSRRTAARRLSVAAAGRQAASSGPQTVIGQTLKALAQYDQVRVEALPPEPSDHLATFVPREAARRLLGDCLTASAGDEKVTAIAERVVEPYGQLGLRAEDAASVIRYELGKQAEPGDVSPETMLRVRIAIFVRLVDDLGLYEEELDSILRTAEVVVGEAV
jgi:hypothetical protein